MKNESADDRTPLIWAVSHIATNGMRRIFCSLIRGTIEPTFTDLNNPDPGKVAEAVGMRGRRVSETGDIGEAVVAWLAQPGPALLDAHVSPMQLVMPPSPLVNPKASGAESRSPSPVVRAERNRGT